MLILSVLDMTIFWPYGLVNICNYVLLQVFNNNIDKDTVILFAARAARLENQDAIDAAITNMLADPKEVGIECSLQIQFSCSVAFLLYSGYKCIKYPFIYRHVQTLQKCIFCPSIQWTSVLPLHTLTLTVIGIGPAKELRNRYWYVDNGSLWKW